jgi:two-component system sensor histidine kinase SenX3
LFTVAEGGQISPEIAELLDVLAAASIVLDASNTVIRASDGALTLGLVQAQLLVHKSLQQLVEEARVSDKPVDREFELVTGLRGERSFVYARAARLEKRFILLLVEDRTEAKRVDETRRDFIANISHDRRHWVAGRGASRWQR